MGLHGPGHAARQKQQGGAEPPGAWCAGFAGAAQGPLWPESNHVQPCLPPCSPCTPHCGVPCYALWEWVCIHAGHSSLATSGGQARAKRYCGVSPAALTTSAHFLRFSCTICLNSSGVLRRMVLPVETKRSATAGSFRALVTASLMRRVSSGSMLFGPNRPNQI